MATKLSEIELNKIIKVDVPADVISLEGQELIRAYLSKLGLDLPKYYAEWEWVSKFGTLPKRIARMFFKSHGYSFTPKQLSEIGNIARTNSEKNNVFYVDFTRTFDWAAGQFADNGSCFWGGRNDARTTMQRNGGYAMRFHRTHEELQDAVGYLKKHAGGCIHHPNGERCATCVGIKSYWAYGKHHIYEGYMGIGRTWVIPQEEESKYYLFNTYGMHQTLTSARLLSLILGLTYAPVRELLNHGQENGTVWINSGTGYIVAAQAREVKHHDLKLKDFKPVYCQQCGTTILDPDDPKVTVDGGRHYCADCSSLVKCNICEKQVRKYKYRRTIRLSRDNSQTCCDDCYSRETAAGVKACSSCGSGINKRHLVTHDNLLFCKDCHDEFPVCTTCGKPAIGTMEGQCRACFYGKDMNGQEQEQETQPHQEPKPRAKKGRAKLHR